MRNQRDAVRIAIGIGTDAEALQKFIGNPEIPLLQANNPGTLVKYIKWASTAVLKSASSPASQSKDAAALGVNVPIPTPPAPDPVGGPASAMDAW